MSQSKFERLSSNPEALSLLKKMVAEGLECGKMQEKLMHACGYKWSTDTIKRRAQAIRDAEEAESSPMLTMPPPGMRESEKAEWFRGKFQKTNLFPILRKQFSPDEVAVYLDNYGLMCCQFEDIVLSEFFQIDDFLKHKILVDRQLISAKLLRQQIAVLQKWLSDNPRTDEEKKELSQFRVLQQHTSDQKTKTLGDVDKRYDELAKERQKLYQSLMATRKDRLDELRGGKETFVALVAKLQHLQIERDKEGKYAELTKIAADDIKREFRKPVKFPDGSEAPIVMDEKTDFEDDQ